MNTKNKHTVMDNSALNEKWPEVSKELSEKFPHLTKEQLIEEIGKDKVLLEELQKKLGSNWSDIKNILSIMG